MHIATHNSRLTQKQFVFPTTQILRSKGICYNLSSLVLRITYNMSVIAIISDSDGSGKTATASALKIQFEKAGLELSLIKLHSLTENSEVENEIYTNLQPQSKEPTSIAIDSSPIKKTDIQNLKSIVKKTTARNNILAIEIASSLNNGLDTIVTELDAKILIVSEHTSDMPNLSLRKLTNNFSDKIIGIIINKQLRYRKNELNEKVLPQLLQNDVNCLGIIPENKSLMAISLIELAKYLEAKLVTDIEPTDKLIDYFLVGGMGLDPGKSYFATRNQKAAVIRGDRPDLQMAALETDPECLILTNGIDPIEYVKYEAEEKNIPVYVVEKSTQEIMSLLNNVHTTVNFNHAQKIDVFTDSFSKYVNIEPISKIIN
ncbi:MAG: hypothetical protein CL768_01135 [Chloroflexi bacterium]|nr:hypothetical protein [Chloroflexota bacterium]